MNSYPTIGSTRNLAESTRLAHIIGDWVRLNDLDYCHPHMYLLSRTENAVCTFSGEELYFLQGGKLLG